MKSKLRLRQSEVFEPLQPVCHTTDKDMSNILKEVCDSP